MTSYLNLTDISSPLAQTFNITEPGGVTLTSVGLYFYSKPGSSEGNFPVTLELRPVTEGGVPSSREIYPGTKVVKSKADIIASTTFDATTGETKFTFPVPLHVPENTQLALTVSTNAAPGGYRVWIAQLGDFVFGSTSKRVTDQPNVGSFFTSSNGTTWTPEQNRDLTFKIYNAQFKASQSLATIYADAPPPRFLSENPFLPEPLEFTSGDSDVIVVHPNHGYLVGDTVELTGLDSNTTYGGVKGSSIMGKRTVLQQDPYGYIIKMDSAASTSTIGGGDVFAIDQYKIDTFKLNLPHFTPQSTSLKYEANMTFGRSPAGSNIPYTRKPAFEIDNKTWWVPPLPFVLMNQYQESDYGGIPSSVFSVTFNTSNINVAPYINLNAATLETGDNVIDFADSAGAFVGVDGFDSNGVDGRNLLVTTTYIPETAPIGGTNTAKFIAVPVTLNQPATSIRVLVDVNRRPSAEFEVYYRTGNLGSIDKYLTRQNWVKFSTSSIPPDVSNYDDMAYSDDNTTFREFVFSKFDLPEFDVYQIKIVMKSTNSTQPPLFKNLRTIATV